LLGLGPITANGAQEGNHPCEEQEATDQNEWFPVNDATTHKMGVGPQFSGFVDA
jgi:hypothetical protein